MCSLDIGCGERKRCDIGVDVRKLEGVDVVCDVRYLPFKGDCFNKIFSSHVLEHISWREVSSVLKEWVRVTKPNGVFEILVPNLRSYYFLRVLIFNQIRINEKGYDLQLIWGGQDYPFNFHKCGFTAKMLKTLLKEYGVDSKIVRKEYLGLPLHKNRFFNWIYQKIKLGKIISLIFPSLGKEIHLIGKKTEKTI